MDWGSLAFFVGLLLISLLYMRESRPVNKRWILVASSPYRVVSRHWTRRGAMRAEKKYYANLTKRTHVVFVQRVY